jgi:hypothetical protein
MNKKNIRRLANALEQNCIRDVNDKRVEFDMSTFNSYSNYPFCGTAACIAGHADLLFSETYSENSRGAALGFTSYERGCVFFTRNCHDPVSLGTIKRKHAIYNLRRILKTGKVEPWDVVLADYNRGERLSDADIKDCTE